MPEIPGGASPRATPGDPMRPGHRLGFSVAILLLLLIGGVAFRSTRLLIASTRAVEHTHDVRRQISGLQTYLSLAESARRGYALSGDETLWEPFADIETQLQGRVVVLRALTRDTPAQQARLDRLVGLLEQRGRSLIDAVTERRERGPQFGQMRLAQRALSDRIRAELQAMDAFETTLLEERRDAAEASARTTVALLTGGGLTALFLLGLAFAALRREAGARARAEAELRQQNGLLENVIRSSGDGIVVTDEKARFVLFNPAAERIVGRGATDAPPDRWAETFGVFLPDGETPFPTERYPLLRSLQGESCDDVEQLIRNPALPAGALIRVSSRPLREADGSIRGALAVLRDVTAEKQAEHRITSLNRELAETVQELRSVNAELEAFSYSVSHDLRAPIRHIDGFVGLLRHHAEGSLDEKGRRYLGVIGDAAKRMGRLIDDLLEFSRTGRADLRRGSVDLEALVQEVRAEVQQDAEGREIAWQVGPLPSVTADRALLRVVLVNLLSNAVKYTRGRSPARIEIGARPGNGRHEVYVRDNGVGFDMAYAHKLFGVFQRLHRTEEFEGTGIGLATVRRVLHRHGGEVSAEGRPDAGATFSFWLPREES